jgi:4-amino-4-deoxy-L-arabinose transferase-like glycosyltransferase
MAFFRFVRQLKTLLTTRLRPLPYRFSASLAESGQACATDPTTLIGTTRVTQPPTRQRVSRELWIVLCALLFVCAIYLLTSGIPKLFDQVDGQYAGAAREMIPRRDWLVPTQDGIPRLQKPPLLYWLEILSLRAFGVDEFAARLPVTLATLGWFSATALIVFRITRRSLAGWASALILAASMGTFFFTHLIMTEPLVAFFLAMTMWCLISALQCDPGDQRKLDRWLLSAWLFIALGSLSKGLHSLAFPVLVAGLSAWFKPLTRPVWRRFLLRPHGWLLFLLITAPWYITTEIRYPGFLVDHLWNEQVGHVLNRRWPPDSERVPLLLFWAEHLVLLFPWTLFLPAWISLRRMSRREPLPQSGGETHVLWFWFLVNAVGITFSSLQDYYLLVSWPVLAFCFAEVFVDTRPVARGYYAVPGLILATLGVVGLICSFWMHPLAADGIATPAIGWTISTAFGPIPADLWRGLEQFLRINSGVALVAGLLIANFGWRRQRIAILAVLAIFMGVVFGAGAVTMRIAQDEFSSAKVARIIENAGSGNTSYRVICAFESNDLTSLFFYLPHRIFWVDAHPETEFATRALGIGKDLYIDEARLLALWRGPERIFLVMRSASLDHWKQVLLLKDANSYLIGRCASRVVLTNRLRP